MKKLISAILALTMMFALVACGGNNNNAGNNNAGNNQTNGNTNANQNADVNNNEDENNTLEFVAPDLNKYFEDFMLSLGEDNAPFMMPADPDTLEAFYAGLGAIATKQCVVQLAAMSAVAFEFALIECENEADVEAVKAILEARKAYQVEGGAWYPEAVEGWLNNSRIVSNGCFVMLAVGQDCDTFVERFNELF